MTEGTEKINDALNTAIQMRGLEDMIFALRAGYAYFYVETNEIGRAVDAIRDIIDGYVNVDGNKPYTPSVWDFEAEPDANEVLSQLDSSDVGTIMVAKNFNWFLQDQYGAIEKRFVQILQNRAELFTSSRYRKALIIVSNVPFDKAIPNALAQDFLPIELGRPDEVEITTMYEDIVTAASQRKTFKVPNRKTRRAIIKAAKGMTKVEIKNAFAYAIVKGQGEFDPLTVSIQKAKDVEKISGLSINKQSVNIEHLIGFDNMEKFVMNSIHSPLARGIAILGPPGTGKTMFARAIGTKVGIPVFEVELALMMGEGLVGQAQNAVKAFLDVVRANTPCILFFDEVEKGLSVASGTSTDGGTGEQSMAQILKFLSGENRPSGIYVMMTANNVEKLSPEWLRPGRIDCAPFYVGLPDEETKRTILKVYTDNYDFGAEVGEVIPPVKIKGKIKSLSGWTGGEIKQACLVAAMHGSTLDKASEYVIPVSKTRKKEIDYLENWAKDRTTPAAKPAKIANGGGPRSIDI